MNKIIERIGYILVILLAIAAAGCGEDEVQNPPGTKANPDVRVFDSLWVEEFMDTTSLCGLNLFYGSSVNRDSLSKDCQLVDTAGSGIDFYLRSGDMSELNVPIGFKTRFNRIYAGLSKANFDTIKVLPVGRDTILPGVDFTEDDTREWGYFNAPLTGDQPVYSFYLEGKSINFHGQNIYGILQPIQAVDTNPGNIGGYSMSFRARINFAGKNDFRQVIPAD